MRKSILTTLAALSALCGAATAQALPPVFELAPVDIAGTLAQDATRSGPQPFRFAVPATVALSPARDGAWQLDADGTAVWRLAVRSPGATSLNFGFTRYQLPPGASLRVMAANGSASLGPYGPEYNRLGQLWTPVIRSEVAEITLRVPAAARAAVQLELGRINHGFRGFGARDTQSGAVQAKSGSCNIDVACSDGDNWRDQIRSVARYTVGGALLCTGQLVNNSAQDFTPYFLTANHCLGTAAQAASTVFYWNYQTSRCGGSPDGSLEQTQIGALFLAGSGGATDVGPDFTLLQLLSTPSAAFDVYYSGWDRRNLAPVGVTGIHHPNGDEKRISMDFDATFISAYAQQPGSVASTLMPTHLMIASWDRGVTEGGSSGSGIWNRERRLVGQLSGGASSCDEPTAPDWYGRMFSNFSTLNTPTTSLSSWLDPTGNVETLDGIDPKLAAPAPPPAPAPTPAPTPVPSPGAGSDSGSSDGGGGGGLFAPWLMLALLLRRTRSARAF